MLDTTDNARATGFCLPDVMRLERRASRTGALEDCVAVWKIPFYAQRKYWLELFIGFNYGLFANVLQHWIMHGIPDQTFNKRNVKLFEYLSRHVGILSMDECLGDLNLKRVSKRVISKRYSRPILHIPSPNRSLIGGTQQRSPLQSLRFRISSANADLDAQSTFDLYNVNIQSVKKDGLMDGTRQSKLSQEQLTELQRSTHFDKKELQQWYKGMNINLCELALY